MLRTLFLVFVLGLLQACHTVEGIGRDIESAGDTITGGAQESRQRINRNY